MKVVDELQNTYVDTENPKRYWIPQKDKNWIGKEHLINITIGKEYEVLVDADDGYYIIDDIGRQSGIFLAHEGKCINWD